MPSAANGDNLYIGRGKFYFDRFDPTTLQPTGNRRFIGEVDKGEITINVTKVERFTTTRAANNKIADINTRQTHTIALDLMEFTKDNVALGLLGSPVTYTQSTTAVAAEQLCATHSVGDILQTAKRSPGTLVLTGPSSTTLVLGTDYEIEDPKLGLIRMLTAGTTVTAAYTPAAVSQPRIAAGQTPVIMGRLIFVGDPTSGPGFDIEAWKVKISPAGVLALLSDDFAKFSITGEILDDSVNHPDAPMYQQTYR